MHPTQLRCALAVTLLMALICLGPRAQAGQVQLAWDAPATNTDGTPITDLSGYKVYYWQPAWEFPGSVDVGDQTAHTLTGLTEGDAYSVAVTAYNVSGNESAYSNTITVTITSPPNDAPVAMADAATTLEDTPVTVPVLANDSDPNGDPLTVAAITQGTHGAVTTDGTAVSYTPTLNSYGPDSFAYTVSDGQGGAATATVTVSVTALNDAPVAMADAATTAEDTPVTVAVLANDTDPDGDPLTVSAVSPAGHGAVSTDGSTVAYTPWLNFQGSDSFAYTVSDGQGGTATATVTVTVTAPEFVMIWREAEEGTLQAPMQVSSEEGTLTSQYVWVSDGHEDVLDSSQDSGFAYYSFDIPEADTYVIWGRVRPDMDGTGSFFIAVDVEANRGSVTDVSPPHYEVAPLYVGAMCYIDASDTITALPAEFDGLVAIKTANADKNDKSAEFFSFTITQAATLYVAYDARTTRFPAWLTASYTPTGHLIDTSDASLIVWKREVAAGTVTLPGNKYGLHGRDGSQVKTNYLVLLAFHEPDPYLVWDIAASEVLTDTPLPWSWNQAASDTDPVFFLDAGPHTLMIKQRESGTKLDKIFLTNDMEAMPQN